MKKSSSPDWPKKRKLHEKLTESIVIILFAFEKKCVVGCSKWLIYLRNEVLFEFVPFRL